MGKRFKTDTKETKKEEKVMPSIKRRCKFRKISSKDNLNKKEIKSNKIAKDLFPVVKPSIEELINSLDGKIKKSEIYKYADFKIDFPFDIKLADFKELFSKGINYAKMHFDEKNLKILKIILLFLKDIKGINSNDEFGLQTCVNDLQKVFRIDLIFTLLTNEKKIENLGQNGMNNIVDEFKKSIDYGIYIDDHSFQESSLYNKNDNNKKEIYPFTIFKDILTSDVVIKVYQEVLNDLYNVKPKEDKIKHLQ